MTEVQKWHEGGMDFAYALHLSQSKNCSELYSFDPRFVNKANGLTAWEVRQP